MLSRSLFLAILALTFSFASAQNLFETQLSLDGKPQYTDIAVLPDGSIFLSGLVNPPSGFDSSQAIVTRLDADLTEVWTRRYKMLTRDDFAAITALSDGHLLVTGASRSNAINLPGGSAYKIDPAGNVLWHHIYTEDNDDRIIAAFERPDSSLILIDREGVTNQPTKILQTDSLGNLISIRAYQDAVSSNGLVIDEAVRGDSGQIHLLGDRFDPALQRNQLVILTITDTSLVRSREYDLGRTLIPSGMAYLDGFIYLAGSIRDTTVTLFDNNAFVAKLTGTGNKVWLREYYESPPTGQFFTNILPVSDGNLVLTTTNRTGDTIKAGLVKIDTAGQQLWTQEFSRVQVQGFSTLEELNDGRLLIAGTADDTAWVLITSANGEGLCTGRPFTWSDSSVLILDGIANFTNNPPSIIPNQPTVSLTDLDLIQEEVCSPSTSIDTQIDDDWVRVYPNPVRDQLFIEWMPETRSELDIILWDLQGRKLVHTQLKPFEKKALEMATFGSGMFVIELSSEGKVLRRKVVDY